MRVLCLVTLLILAGFQYTYWFGPSGFFELRQMDHELQELQKYNQKILKDNLELRKEIARLRTSPDRIEEIARTDLGMIAKDEKFYLVVHNQ